MEDTLEDAILVLYLNLLMNDDQYDSFVCLYRMKRWKLFMVCVVCVRVEAIEDLDFTYGS